MVVGLTDIPKSFTAATAGGGAGVNLVFVPKTDIMPPSLRGPAALGLKITRTVALAPALSEPTVQITTPPVELQLDCPGELLAETKVALTGTASVKMTPLIKSPLLTAV